MRTLSFADILAIPLHELAKRNPRPVKVAVLDTGIDGSHEALKGKIVGARGYLENSAGKYEPVELCAKSNNDPSGHGTGVAAIIARIAPNARIADYRVLDADSGGSGLAVLRGLEDAVDSDAEIINVSIAFRKDRYWDATVKLLEKAYQNGKIVVASKRNMPMPDDLGLPAEISSCISVDNGAFAHPYSLRYLRNSKIEFSAYGTEVLTARSGGGYVRMTGTSFATPVVAACCALLRGVSPRLTLFEAKTFLKHCAATRGSRKHRVENPLETFPALHPGGQPTSVHRCLKCGFKETVVDAVEQVRCPRCGTVSARKPRYNPLVFAALLNEVGCSVPPEYCYHGLFHAQNVYRAVCYMLARYPRMPAGERKALLCAAVMHDAGYRMPSAGHERESVMMLRGIWPVRGIREDSLKRVERLILSTAPDAVPTDVSERILRDADMFCIGTDSYWDSAALLRKERADAGECENDEEWLRGQLALLVSHRFQQAWLEKERKPVRDRHIREIRRRLAKLPSGGNTHVRSFSAPSPR